MLIVIKFYGHLKEFSTNASELSVEMVHDGDTVRSLIKVLSEQFGKRLGLLIDPKTGELAPAYLIAVNGKLAGLNTSLKDNDVVAFIPALDGG